MGPPTSPEVRAKIGVATQALAIYDELSTEENLRFFARIQGITTGKIPERVAWSHDFVGLVDRRRDRVKTFSGGMYNCKKRISYFGFV